MRRENKSVNEMSSLFYRLHLGGSRLLNMNYQLPENTLIAFFTSSFIACIAAYSTSCR